MLDNWTRDGFFKEIRFGLDIFAAVFGRIAITDDPELEKLYDRYVQARQEIFYKFEEWKKNV